MAFYMIHWVRENLQCRSVLITTVHLSLTGKLTVGWETFGVANDIFYDIVLEMKEEQRKALGQRHLSSQQNVHFLICTHAYEQKEQDPRNL